RLRRWVAECFSLRILLRWAECRPALTALTVILRPGRLAKVLPRRAAPVVAVVAAVVAVGRVFRAHSLRGSIGFPARGSNGSPDRIPGTSRTTPNSQWIT